jgi:hypothetical protein
MTLPMPPLEMQKRAIQLIESVIQARGIQNKTTTELQAILPALINRAFGEGH